MPNVEVKILFTLLYISLRPIHLVHCLAPTAQKEIAFLLQFIAVIDFNNINEI